MKWVEVKGTHINTNRMQTFYWKDGKLVLWLTGDWFPLEWDDPDRELYRKLCRQQGLRPAEED